MNYIADNTVELEKAISLLKQGSPVAIPTETVYGLAAPIHNREAIKKIFSLKERPFFDPLIIHISETEEIYHLIKTPTALMRDSIEKLASAFWPGPLTLVLPKDDKIDSMITSGLDTVGIRLPSHPLTKTLIKMLGTPLAAPSANKFGKTSPTSAEHIKNTWSEDEVYTLDGGPCEVGIESTVMALVEVNSRNSSNAKTIEAQILRKGKISIGEIRKVLGPAIKIVEMESSASPGHTPEHYMPDKPLIIVPENFCLPSTGYLSPDEAIYKILIEHPGFAKMIPSEPIKFSELNLNDRPEIIARTLYADMRNLAKSNIDIIIAPGNKFLSSNSNKLTHDENESWMWAAIWDRLKRASSLEISNL